MVYVRAFLVGGLICMLVQIFLDHTRLMPGRVMVLLVIAGVILGAVGIYEPLQQWAGCGPVFLCPDLGIIWQGA